MLHAFHREAKSGSAEAAANLGGTLRFLGVWNGEMADEIANYGLDASDLPSSEDIDGYIAARTAARTAKNWAESDRIRDELAAKGIVLKDGKGADGKPVTTWEVAR
jgi:cysteinyl-tRNA synthetase